MAERPSWYLDGVKEKKNYEWTTEEKRQVYTFRNKDKIPAEIVAKIFGVTVTQIYNITRITRKAYKSQCFICGNKLSKEDMEKNKGKFIKACSTCKMFAKEYKRRRRNKFLKKGLCGYCETNPRLPGQTSCKKCISQSYRRRYQLGLCGRCGKYPIADGSTTLCKKCREKNKERAKIYREKAK